MQVNCPGCGAAVRADDINIRRMVAKCAACNEVFALDPSLSPTPSSHQRARVPQPPSITVERAGVPADPAKDGTYREPPPDAAGRDPGPLVMKRRWLGPTHFFMLFFAVFWDGFLVFWYQTALDSGDADPVALLFPLLHVAAGVYITYIAITGFLNRTTITVAEGRLKVAHGPLPWPGNLDLDASRLRQLFVRRKSYRTKGGGERSTYAVAADMNGTALDILRSLSNVDEARFIEQTIETHLGIVDDPTAGDV